MHKGIHESDQLCKAARTIIEEDFEKALADECQFKGQGYFWEFKPYWVVPLIISK
jgi:hypothetical protein